MKKMLIVISGFACIYKCVFLVIIFIIGSALFLLFIYFSLRNGESMFCAAFLSRKTNLLDLTMKIGT